MRWKEGRRPRPKRKKLRIKSVHSIGINLCWNKYNVTTENEI
jgi:hypothetical protein